MMMIVMMIVIPVLMKFISSEASQEDMMIDKSAHVNAGKTDGAGFEPGLGPLVF